MRRGLQSDHTQVVLCSLDDSGVAESPVAGEAVLALLQKSYHISPLSRYRNAQPEQADSNVGENRVAGVHTAADKLPTTNSPLATSKPQQTDGSGVQSKGAPHVGNIQQESAYKLRWSV